MDKQIKHFLELYNQKRFSKIESIPINKMLKVDSEKVTKVIKKNHSYLTCTCQSSGKTGHNSFCRHKQFFIVFPILRFFNKNIDQMLDYYTIMKNLKKNVEPFTILDDLNKLKRVL